MNPRIGDNICRIMIFIYTINNIYLKDTGPEQSLVSLRQNSQIIYTLWCLNTPPQVYRPNSSLIRVKSTGQTPQAYHLSHITRCLNTPSKVYKPNALIL